MIAQKCAGVDAGGGIYALHRPGLLLPIYRLGTPPPRESYFRATFLIPGRAQIPQVISAVAVEGVHPKPEPEPEPAPFLSDVPFHPLPASQVPYNTKPLLNRELTAALQVEAIDARQVLKGVARDGGLFTATHVEAFDAPQVLEGVVRNGGLVAVTHVEGLDAPQVLKGVACNGGLVAPLMSIDVPQVLEGLVRNGGQSPRTQSPGCSGLPPGPLLPLAGLGTLPRHLRQLHSAHRKP